MFIDYQTKQYSEKTERNRILFHISKLLNYGYNIEELNLNVEYLVWEKDKQPSLPNW